MTVTVLGDFAVHSDPYNRELLPLQLWKTTITMAAATGSFSPSSKIAGSPVAVWIDPITLTAGATIKGWCTTDAFETTGPDYFVDYTAPNPAVETRTALAKRTLVSGTVEIDVASATTADSFVLYVWVDPSAATDVVTNAIREDSAHTSTDYGTMALAVRNDTPTTLAGTTGDYAPLQVDANGSLKTRSVPYPVSPVMTLYTPVTTAYVKVTPNAADLDMLIAPQVTTETLQIASLVTHKIVEATSIAAADPDDLPKSITAADEMYGEINTHIASLTYHVAAGTAFIEGHKVSDETNLSTADNMADLATGYTLYAELKLDLTAHAASAVIHNAAVAVAPTLPATPNSESLLVAATNATRLAMIAHFGSVVAHSPADVENVRLVTALAADAVNTAGCLTNLNAIKACYNSHCGVGDVVHADLPAVIVSANAIHAALLAHFADATVAHGGRADAVALAAQTLGVAATNLATAYALLHVSKDAYNAHGQVCDGGIYFSVGAAVMPCHWPCLGSFFCKTNVSAHSFTT
ncbi:MAG: hypothetical protein WBL92_08330, partial [Methanothrix sp.]